MALHVYMPSVQLFLDGEVQKDAQKRETEFNRRVYDAIKRQVLVRLCRGWLARVIVGTLWAEGYSHDRFRTRHFALVIDCALTLTTFQVSKLPQISKCHFSL